MNARAEVTTIAERRRVRGEQRDRALAVAEREGGGATKRDRVAAAAKDGERKERGKWPMLPQRVRHNLFCLN